MPRVETFHFGDTVLCDWCDKEWTQGMPGSGGFTFGSRAICPDCAPDVLTKAKQYNEEQYIGQRQPLNKDFWTWVVEDLRGGEPGTITITSWG